MEGLVRQGVFPSVPLPEIYVDVNRSRNHYVCFEEVYNVFTWGRLVESYEVAQRLREALVSPSVYRGDVHPDLDTHKTPSFISSPPPPSLSLSPASLNRSASLREACLSHSLRLAYFNRSSHSLGGQRGVFNTQQLLSTMQSFSSTPVLIFSTTSADSVDSQFLAFNSFDILVTTPGSQIANLLLTNSTEVGVVEIGLAIRDDFWRVNALKNLKLKKYVYCHGHSAASMQVKELLKRCSTDQYNVTDCGEDGTNWLVTDGSFYINPSRLKHALSHVVT
eukprot:CAMPEP_0182424274 /NCGR_PEP_ID=MMETSP1167-20130531/10450_1 /TAXON_ID=2988 /ORGANISM="Mallomonas Sp, Strain CCMP3275" /LENGTH=277 /DNA_ID=CAMNT_0024603945 /DNA_START=508 /DNA_END=1337 /DNA_ORIENTATION=-